MFSCSWQKALLNFKAGDEGELEFLKVMPLKVSINHHI